MSKAVILAGGLGTRLKPFTDAIPKPLLPIGEKSVLELQISNLARYGFKEIFIATNYKADYVEAFMGDGKRLGVNIRFSKEEKALGTCGPLTLIREELNEPFIMMNGDILTNLDFQKVYEFGKNIDSPLTVVTKEIRTPFNFGSVKISGNYIIDVEEKPDLVLEIVGGIYFMKPEIFKYIPENEYYGIDSLIKKLIAEKIPVGRYLMNEFWIDIGQIDDFKEAQDAYDKHFKN
jgi:NDP-sugar pyrophosphorylase family protein